MTTAIPENVARELTPGADGHVREVVRSAERELHQLLRQRAEIMKRIGTLKQTLGGLANVFGEWVLDDELLVLLDRKSASRRSGFTRACRQVLMNSTVPLSARQICESLHQNFPELRERHKNLYASVTTVLSRLVEYSEARSSIQPGGHRVWQWIADSTADSSPENVVQDAAVLGRPAELDS